jgi:alpha-tubulin suppressor-like RCC1 family protein
MVSPSLPDGAAVTCERDTDCPHGYTCREDAGLCVSERGDQNPPVLLVSELTPRAAREGTSLTLALTFDEPLGGPPECYLSAGSAWEWQSGVSAPDAFHYGFSYRPDGTETEGPTNVTATATDVWGNRGYYDLGQVTLDFTAPTLSEPAWADGLTRARAGTIVSASAVAGADAEAITTRLLSDSGAELLLLVAGVNQETVGAETAQRVSAIVDLASSAVVEQGVLVVEISASDAVGNTTTTNSAPLAVDGTPPETVLDAAPSDPAHELEAVFAFSSPDTDVAGFRCTLDDGPEVECTSPYAELLADTGEHRFTVSAYDDVGNQDLSPATHTWIETRRWTAVSVSELDSASTYDVSHICAIASDGSLWCWGHNRFGQLGLGWADLRNQPLANNATLRRVGAERDWLAVHAGYRTTCGVRRDGGSRTVWCWGWFTTPFPTPMDVGGGWASIKAPRVWEGCGLKMDGSVWYWGYDAADGVSGQVLVAVQLDAERWLDVDASDDHVCGVREDHTMWCWGSNAALKLGHDVPNGAIGQVGDEQDWIVVAAGTRHTCGVRQIAGTGQLWCWGSVDQEDRMTPIQIGAGIDWRSVQIRDVETCGLDAAAHIHCFRPSDPQPAIDTWGGHGIFSARAIPDLPWGGFSATSANLCAVSEQGELVCLGFDEWGQLLRPDRLYSVGEPQPVGGGAAVWKDIVALGSGTCGLQDDGSLWCWGQALRAAGVDDWPEQVEPGALWRAAALTENCVCGILDSAPAGSLACYGTSATSCCTNGTVGADTDWAQIDAGTNHRCAIRSGMLNCWGSNSHGQLGISSTSSTCTPTQVEPGTNDWAHVSVGDAHTCGIRDDGSEQTVWCWGDYEDGRLGIGTVTEDQLAPQQLAGTDWLAVTAGYTMACGIRGAGTLWCWGTGNLGTGGSGPEAAPVQVGGDADWAGISLPKTAYGRPYAWKTGGSLWEMSTIPRVVDIAPSPVDVAASGANHVCTLSQKRTHCWGKHTEGQLGAGDTWGPVTIVPSQD